MLEKHSNQVSFNEVQVCHPLRPVPLLADTNIAMYERPGYVIWLSLRMSHLKWSVLSLPFCTHPIITQGIARTSLEEDKRQKG